MTTEINCVAQAVAEFWPEANVIGINTDSQVSDQPNSDVKCNGARCIVRSKPCA